MVCPEKVVLFYHLPKAGGSTIVNRLRDAGFNDHVSARSDMAATSHLQSLRTCNNAKLAPARWLLLEIHPIAFLPHERLWIEVKESLRAKDVRVAAVGLLRDPVDHMVSVYNWCCGQESMQKQFCGKGLRGPAQMLAAIGRNLQCTNIVAGWMGGRPTSAAHGLNISTCLAVFTRYRDAMDFVGVTARLDETIAALESFFGVSMNRTAARVEKRT